MSPTRRRLVPSGVDWIGEMPEGWKVSRFKYHAVVKANLVNVGDYQTLPQISPESIEKNSGRVLAFGTVEDAGVISDNHLFNKGQILYTKIRPTLNKVVIAPCDGLCCADMYPIETSEDKKFILYLMLSDCFVSQAKMVSEIRIKMPKINIEELARICVSIPPLSEQREIAAYLDKKCAAIDAVLAKRRKQLEGLAEYRKSVIYAYVTGKKEVERGRFVAEM